MKLSELRKLTRFQERPEDLKTYQRFLSAIRETGLDPDNLYQELEMESRYVDTHRDTSYNNTGANLHSHTFWEILYCCSTCGAEYLVGAERYRIQKGDIIIVPPGMSHRPLLPENLEEPYRRYVLWISLEFFHRFQQVFPNRELFQTTETRLLRTAETKWEFLGDIFRKGVEEAESQDVGWEAAVAANTMTLLVQMRRMILQRTVKQLKAEKPELLDRVMAYVESNLSQKITLAEIARHFYVSESTISQLFRKKMGVSFYHCVTQRRLIAAKSLIMKGVPMETVSEKVGFADYSSFYRAFKQEYGISPRQYRKLQTIVEEE